MELVCTSKHLVSSIATAIDVTGREHLVIVAKASWRIPAPRQRPRPLPPQPLAVADAYHGVPGRSAMRYCDDFARFKPRCDVLFDACAHAPSGHPIRQLDLAVQVGALNKRIRVFGPRNWTRGLLGLTPSEPEPFIRMPLHFGHAFGGSRSYDANGKTLTEALLTNPDGLGWGGPNTARGLVGAPVANLEHPDDQIKRPDGPNQPVALSAIGRHWQPRQGYAGTYDDAWRRDVAPFLPEDFDDRFHQCAPEDQQIDYPRGGETVRLNHLVPSCPALAFSLPQLDGVKVRILRTDYSTEQIDAVVDTLFFETDAERFSAVWRASSPIRRRLQEFDTIAVGPIEPEWWRARSLGLDDHGCPGCGETPA
ncbi:DUF2169 domain-containing protein [Azoarcus sp. L1K30]|uniref:DUF2169 family type VI secretion system accessory protein n=1 Tax=Azoarcus sp. L1K30 TaxID=2820277 RepID=UPI001B83FF4C|nr:DUF2169 domain-containing protein [Azoarcus sp. L1K30]MBR0565986.1 DUF2169 domain-containing protein [Azoarcus sp. L1K30]